MAVPSYTTDLVDIDLCEAGGKTWAEPTAVGWAAGAAPASSDDDAIQGLLSMAKAYNATGVGGMLVNNGAGITLPSDGAFLGWFFWACPGSLDTDANGGIRIIVGTDLVNFLSWDIGGLPSYTYGGWTNYAVNTTITADDTVGTGLGNSQYCGAAVSNLNSIFKGSPFVSDAYRYGRCEARINGGESGNYATFAGYAAINDLNTASGYNRWGLFQEISGGYLQKGLMVFGYTSAVDFRDSNRNIFIQNTTKVTQNFNTFEVRQATSHIDWTGISITALGTVSKGRFLAMDNATITFDTCTFTDMNTFVFASGANLQNILATTFRRCGIVTQNGATFTNCKFDSASDTKALVVDTIANVTATQFIGKGTGYALEGFSTAGAYTFTNLTFSGYGATETTDAAIHVLATTGTVAISISGGNTPTYKTEGATVTFPSSVPVTVTVVDKNNAPIEFAQTGIYKTSDNTPVMNQDTNASGIATTSYTGSTPCDIIARVRKSSEGATKYISTSTTGTIVATSGYSVKITLIEDPNA